MPTDTEELKKAARRKQRQCTKQVADILKEYGYDPECGVRDLLADIRHYCDAKKLDYDHESDVAYGNYEAECVGGDLLV